MQLYRTLHPEDKTSTEAELTDITIKNVLADGIYNDLGFLLGDKFMILLEAQSLWTLNIIIRALLYLAQTYHDYFERTSQNLYKSKKVNMPKLRCMSFTQAAERIFLTPYPCQRNFLTVPTFLLM